jgi:type IV fimbrial biogenesis protein FimT
MMEVRGFTLVELIVSLAILAILLVIAIPSFKNTLNRNRLSSTTNDFVSALQLTRSEAIKRNQRVTVCKSDNAAASAPICNAASSWHQGWLIFVDGGTRGFIDAGDTLLKVQEGFPGFISISASSNYSNYISYISRGSSQGSGGLANGTVQICAGNSRRDIIINNTGRIRLRQGAC